MYVTLIIIGLVAGLLSGSVGFGGGMILLPVITYFYGVEVAVPVISRSQAYKMEEGILDCSRASGQATSTGTQKKAPWWSLPFFHTKYGYLKRREF